MEIMKHVHYFSLILVGLFMPLSMGVSIKEDQEFCYPVWTAPKATEKSNVTQAPVPVCIESTDWHEICTSGQSQSPIDIEKEVVKKGVPPSIPEDAIELNLDMDSYNHKRGFHIVNTGHTIQITPVKAAKVPRNKDLYVFAEAHFHWDSEHTIDGERFDLEMHLVHFKSKYTDVTKAAESGDRSALSVIALLFKDCDQYGSHDSDCNYNLHEGPGLHVIKNNFPLLPDGSEKVIKLKLEDFIPKKGATFYRYHGSLTTPDCNEVVEWNVFDRIRKLSYGDMESFQQAKKDKNGTLPLGPNYRETKPENGRHITRLSIKIPAKLSSCIGLYPNARWLILTTIFHLLVRVNPVW